MITEVTTILIAVLSFILSVYVLVRDRKYRKFDHLYNCRQRILDIFDNHEILTVDQLIEYLEEDPDSEAAKKHAAVSEDISARVNREFEFTCYLVIKKQVELDSFYDIFKGYLLGRYLMWDEYRKKRYPYTWKVIRLCEKKKLIPLKKTKADVA